MSDDGADAQRVNAVDEPDVQLLAWAVVNCHTLARRELNRLRPYVTPDTLAIERWEHVLRICEKAGARSKGVLRASLPTEITDGSESQNDIGFRDLIADGGLPEARRVAPLDPLREQIQALIGKLRTARRHIVADAMPRKTYGDGRADERFSIAAQLETLLGEAQRIPAPPDAPQEYPDRAILILGIDGLLRL